MAGFNNFAQNGEFQVETSKAKKINSLLNSAQTRISGLQLLDKHLPEISDEELIESCVSWMQNCCKIDGQPKSSNFAVEVLDKLFKISSNYTELKKSVSFFITTRFFDYFFKYLLNSPSGWNCAETCFLLYRGACGPFLEAITKHLNAQLQKNSKLPPVIASCFALLPSLGGGGNEGVNYKSNWNIQFHKYIQICHSILNDLFINIEELQEYDTGGHSYHHRKENLTPGHQILQLYNYSNILRFMLLNKYPTPKSIPTDLLLQLICRGLAVNFNIAGKNLTADIIGLKKVLPEVHEILHSLLSALIVTCGNHLLPYSQVICKLIKQTLEWTQAELLNGSNKPYDALRIRTYESLCNWLSASRSGSCVETISKTVISSAVDDIQAKKNAVVLKESKQKKPVKKIEETRRRVDTLTNSSLCFAALKALQYLVKYVGVLLKQEEHKFLQEVSMSLLTQVQNRSTTEISIPYSLAKCRTELYCLLLELVQQPCAAQPPPTHFALRIFSRGQNDSSALVSQFCASAVNSVINIIHSPFDNSGFVMSDNGQSREVCWREERIIVDDTVNVSVEQNTEIIDDVELIHEKSPEKSALPINKENETDEEEKISNPDDSEEDSVIAIPHSKSIEEKEQTSSDPHDEKIEEVVEPASKKSRLSVDIKLKTPSPTKSDKTTSPKTHLQSETKSPAKEPEIEIKESSKKPEEDSNSARSPSSDSPNEDHVSRDPRKRYFLRSKTPKASSEESEEIVKTSSSSDHGLTTPVKSSSKTTPSTNKRPRTRASSKLETIESESEKKELDDDEDIIYSFNDSFAE